MKKILIFAVLVALVGCTPATQEGVRALSPDRSVVFVANDNYQAVYRRILEQERKCYQVGMATGQLIAQGDIYTDIKSGAISLTSYSGLGVNIIQLIDVSFINENTTKIIARYPVGNIDDHVKILRAWVVDGDTGCGSSSNRS